MQGNEKERHKYTISQEYTKTIYKTDLFPNSEMIDKARTDTDSKMLFGKCLSCSDGNEWFKTTNNLLVSSTYIQEQTSAFTLERNNDLA